MRPAFEYGEAVRLIRNVRNDGTYPGMDMGTLLVRRGSVGCVYDVGTYLQDQLIYRVHFLEAGRTVGCREEELISADAPWIPNKFEFRDAVVSTLTVSQGDKTVVEEGQKGSIEKVMVDHPKGPMYHVHFGQGYILQMPEAALAPATPASGESEVTHDNLS